jgi:hypothetical protein
VQAASEKPDTSSLHLFVEHVDIANHFFALDGRVVVIRVVNRYQKLLHVFSYIVVSGRPFAPPSFSGRTAGPEFDRSPREFLRERAHRGKVTGKTSKLLRVAGVLPS